MDLSTPVAQYICAYMCLLNMRTTRKTVDIVDRGIGKVQLTKEHERAQMRLLDDRWKGLSDEERNIATKLCDPKVPILGG